MGVAARFLRLGDDAHVRSPGAARVKAHDFAFLELDNTISHGKNRIIFAHADIFSRLNGGAALADNNLAGVRELSIGDLNAQSLTM